MFPMLEHCHWFLCVMQPREALLYILDPYVKEDTMDNIMTRHSQSLTKLEEDFLRPHYEEKKNMDLPELHKSVVLPPAIPAQEDSFNCGVFMLEFER